MFILTVSKGCSIVVFLCYLYATDSCTMFSDEYYVYHTIHTRSVSNDTEAQLKHLVHRLTEPVLMPMNESTTLPPVSGAPTQEPGLPFPGATGMNYTTTNMTQTEHTATNKTAQPVLNVTVPQDKNITTPVTNSTGAVNVTTGMLLL